MISSIISRTMTIAARTITLVRRGFCVQRTKVQHISNYCTHHAVLSLYLLTEKSNLGQEMNGSQTQKAHAAMLNTTTTLQYTMKLVRRWINRLKKHKNENLIVKIVVQATAMKA